MPVFKVPPHTGGTVFNFLSGGYQNAESKYDPG